jgi:hypothetical protein
VAGSSLNCRKMLLSLRGDDLSNLVGWSARLPPHLLLSLSTPAAPMRTVSLG